MTLPEPGSWLGVPVGVVETQTRHASDGLPFGNDVDVGLEGADPRFDESDLTSVTRPFKCVESVPVAREIKRLKKLNVDKPGVLVEMKAGKPNRSSPPGVDESPSYPPANPNAMKVREVMVVLLARAKTAVDSEPAVGCQCLRHRMILPQKVLSRMPSEHTLPARSSGASFGDVKVYDSAMAHTDEPGVLQMRVVVEVDDFDEAVRFYRDVLGLRESAAFEGDGDARVMILEAGRATFELANKSQVDMIDAVEVGRRVSPHIRLAFEVPDAAATTDSLTSNGARLIAPPTETPWRSLNSRLDGPAGLQLTLFQELSDQ